MNIPEIFKKKTFWAGVAFIVTSIGCYFTGECTAVETAQAVIGAIMGIFIRQGIITGSR